LVEAVKAVAPFLSAVGSLFSAIAPPIITIVTLLLNLLAPAFKKFTEIVDKFLKPFLENLPKNFENMINRVINSMNSFIRTINGFVDKVSGVLGKIGINIDLPKLREFGNVSFGLAEQKVASLTAPAVKSPADTVSSLLAGQQQMQKQVGQAVMNNTFNISGNTGNPQEVAQKTVEALRQYNRTSGALNRVLTIE